MSFETVSIFTNLYATSCRHKKKETTNLIPSFVMWPPDNFGGLSTMHGFVFLSIMQISHFQKA